MVHLSKVVYSIAQVLPNLEINFGFDEEELECFNACVDLSLDANIVLTKSTSSYSWCLSILCAVHVNLVIRDVP